MTFPLFSQLPTEIQCQIWQECLPKRTIQINFPETQRADFWHMLLYQRWDRQYCMPHGCVQVLQANSAPPVISRVCHQSREVARMRGKSVQRSIDSENPLQKYWVQQRGDVLHLNQSQRCLPNTDTDGAHASPVQSFLESAAALGVPVSLSHRILFNFSRLDLLASLIHSEAIVDLQAIAQMGRQPLEVVIQEVVIHVDRDAGAQSGLFGPMGEAFLKSVDVWDTAHIRRYRSLWEMHSAQQDAKTKEVFDLFEAPDQLKERLSIWLDKVYFRLIGSMWALPGQAKRSDGDLSDVWAPPVSKGFTPSSDTNKLKYDHPWVREVYNRLPRIEPKIMFRHCFSWHCKEE